MRISNVFELRFTIVITALACLACVSGSGLRAQEKPLGKVKVAFSPAQGIGATEGVMRRDPSDIIKVGDLYYVWYSKGKIAPGYDATIWYATSPDGHHWTEKAMAIDKGQPGSWEGASVFTPNILVAQGRYWLFYTGVSREYRKPYNPDSKIGIAVADSPDGPWQRLASNPALANSDNPDDFDSHLVDDACLITRDGKYWLYYKGRQLGKGPGQTQMGLAIAHQPQGPYQRVKQNPVIPGNHEVLVWPQGSGVAAMIGTTGPAEIKNSVLYAADGMNFTKTHDVTGGPWAGGSFRPDAFTDNGRAQAIQWGVHIGRRKQFLPFIERFDMTTSNAVTQFHDDVAFLKTHTPIVLLENENAAVAIAPDYQGRVMTSTFDQESGPSFGWINRKVIAAGLLSQQERKGKLEEHIYIFGGEERFWLGPEGGQFALFFPPGAKFDFEHWSTPAAIDTEPFEVVDQSKTSAEFSRECELTNFSGTRFQMKIRRTVQLLEKPAIANVLGTDQLPAGVEMVAYQTDNRLTNVGKDAWTPQTGMPSIWLLGMYNPSPQTTIVIPFKAGDDSALGPKVNDSYFGKVPAEHLRVEADVLFFKGDGTRRGKIGVSPQRSKGIAGSYDAAGNVLTVVKYNVQEAPAGYVNSMWEHQAQPFAGDVINAYNDGSPAPGQPPLGPFYELETSSPAAALAPGQTMKHVQTTLHIKGTPQQLDPIAKQLFGVSIAEIQASRSNAQSTNDQ